jgi:predicted DNA-binding transcriptional regulator YafY
VRADRLLRLVLLLQTRGRMTAARLALELEVSVRTIYRDLEALSGAGFPVYTEKGPGGGCLLVDGYRTNLTGLSAPEAQALAFAALPGAAAELGVGALAAAAHLKVVSALTPDARDTITTAQRCFHLDPHGWFRTSEPDHPLLPDLARAVWTGHQVEAEYRRRNSAAQPRVIAPLGLVLKAGLWYLVAGTTAGIRAYRVSRFTTVDVLEQPVERPAGFDLGAWWNQWSAAFEAGLPEYHVTVRLAPSALDRLSELGDAVTRAPDQPPAARDRDGWQQRTLTFERAEWAEAGLLRLGAEVEVLDPPELRERLHRTAVKLHDLYTNDP